MRKQHDHSEDLIEKLLLEDEQAISEVVDLYFERLVRIAQKQLSSMPSQVGDAEGAVQSAFRSFFSGIRHDQFGDLDHSGLWKILVTITVRKAIAQLRHHFKVSGEGGKRNYAADLTEIIDTGPTPEQAVTFLLECEYHLQRLDKTLQRIATLKLEGYKNREIAEILKIDKRSVQRKLSIIRDELIRISESEYDK